MAERGKKTIVITGASDGIGAEAARILSQHGHEPVVIGRSPEKTEQIAQSVGAPWYVCDFSSLEQVRKLARKLRDEVEHIDVLANNAGGMFGRRELTEDGHEKTFQVNHLAHFLLTRMLLDKLVASRATVINTSSIAHKLFADFNIDDLDLENGYSEKRAYGNAKLANILFTRELHERYHEKGLKTAAFHPGNVATNFAHDTSSILKYVYHTPIKYIAGLISPAKGADTLVWLAEHDGWDSGEYYVKRKKARTSKDAADEKSARKLWEISEKMTNA
jgi:NAD(P)-dependent dehydrogenase (short-subunit alcohol dehydrogenase family)